MAAVISNWISKIILQEGDCIIIGIYARKKPHKLSFDGGKTFFNESSQNTTLECPSASHGEWIFDGTLVLFASKIISLLT